MCAKWVRNLQPFMEDQISLEEYTASLCCGSLRNEKLETNMVQNVYSNRIEITCDIHKSLYFLPYKNHHESLPARRVFVHRLTMTWTRLIHCSNLCSSSIGLGFFALLSLAGFLLTLRLFVASSFTIGAKYLFSTVVLMQESDDRSINWLKLSRSGRCRTSTNWQRWFKFMIQVESKLFCERNQIMLSFWHTWLFADLLLHQLV